MIDEFALPEEDHDDIDIFAALGLNTPVSDEETHVQNAYDPLAAFMDDDDEDDAFPAEAFATSSVVSTETVESLLETLARDLLDHERLSASVSGGRIDMDSLTVARPRRIPPVPHH